MLNLCRAGCCCSAALHIIWSSRKAPPESSLMALRFRVMRDGELQPSVVEYTQLLQALAAEPCHPDLEKVFREMIASSVQPTRVTIKAVEKLLGRRPMKRLLEELDVDETALGDLSMANFQRRRASTAPRAQERERQKRQSYLTKLSSVCEKKQLQIQASSQAQVQKRPADLIYPSVGRLLAASFLLLASAWVHVMLAFLTFSLQSVYNLFHNQASFVSRDHRAA